MGNRPSAQTRNMAQPRRSPLALCAWTTRCSLPCPPSERPGESHGQQTVPRRSAPGLRPRAPFQCRPQEVITLLRNARSLCRGVITMRWNSRPGAREAPSTGRGRRWTRRNSVGRAASAKLRSESLRRSARDVTGGNTRRSAARCGTGRVGPQSAGHFSWVEAVRASSLQRCSRTRARSLTPRGQPPQTACAARAGSLPTLPRAQR